MQRLVLCLSALLISSPMLASAHSKHHSMPMMSGKKMPHEQRMAGNPVAADGASLARGAAIFKTYCVTCHGTKGAGDGPAAAGLTAKPADLRMLAGRAPDQRFAAHITQGGPVMPPFKDVLKENQIWDVTNFVQSLAQ